VATIIHLKIELPDRLLREFLQHYRDYDAKHMHEMHAEILVLSPSLPSAKIREIMGSLTPPFEFNYETPLGES
jgi:hypothetical protein